MNRKDTRPLTVNGNIWEYKIGRKCVAIHDPEGNRYYPRRDEIHGNDLSIINPARILDYIQEKILKPKFIEFGMNQCKYCKQKKVDVILRADPYAAEIHQDYTNHFICNECIGILNDDI